MKHIAYGSSMVAEQMAYRCPTARLLGTGLLLNHRLEVHLHATVEKARSKGTRVPVAVWEIYATDEMSPNRYEGVPTYYMRAIRPYPPEKVYYNGSFHVNDRLPKGSGFFALWRLLNRGGDFLGDGGGGSS